MVDLSAGVGGDLRGRVGDGEADGEALFGVVEVGLGGGEVGGDFEPGALLGDIAGDAAGVAEAGAGGDGEFVVIVEVAGVDFNHVEDEAGVEALVVGEGGVGVVDGEFGVGDVVGVCAVVVEGVELGLGVGEGVAEEDELCVGGFGGVDGGLCGFDVVAPAAAFDDAAGAFEGGFEVVDGEFVFVDGGFEGDVPGVAGVGGDEGDEVVDFEVVEGAALGEGPGRHGGAVASAGDGEAEVVLEAFELTGVFGAPGEGVGGGVEDGADECGVAFASAAVVAVADAAVAGEDVRATLGVALEDFAGGFGAAAVVEPGAPRRKMTASTAYKRH